MPVGVALGERRGGDAVSEDGEADGDEGGREDQALVGEPALLEDEEREDDGRGAAWAEPAEERDGRSPRTGSEHRDRDGEHAHDGQAEDGVERDLPGEVADRRPEQHGAEDDERHGCEDCARLLDEVRDLAAAVPPHAAEGAARRRTRR